MPISRVSLQKFDTYIGHTTMTPSCRLTFYLSGTSAVKQHLTTEHNNDTEKLTSSDIQKIFNDNTRTLYKINNKNCQHINEATCINMNEKAFNPGTIILNIFNN